MHGRGTTAHGPGHKCSGDVHGRGTTARGPGHECSGDVHGRSTTAHWVGRGCSGDVSTEVAGALAWQKYNSPAPTLAPYSVVIDSP